MCYFQIFWNGWNTQCYGNILQSCLYGHQNVKNCRLTTQSHIAEKKWGKEREQ